MLSATTTIIQCPRRVFLKNGVHSERTPGTELRQHEEHHDLRDRTTVHDA